MQLKIDKQDIDIILANTFKKRLIGLLGQKEITFGMLFPHCHSIHTFFMSNPIDVIVLSSNYKILEIYEAVKPNRIILSKQKKASILELPAHTSSHFTIGQTLSFDNPVL